MKTLFDWLWAASHRLAATLVLLTTALTLISRGQSRFAFAFFLIAGGATVAVACSLFVARAIGLLREMNTINLYQGMLICVPGVLATALAWVGIVFCVRDGADSLTQTVGLILLGCETAFLLVARAALPEIARGSNMRDQAR